MRKINIINQPIKFFTQGRSPSSYSYSKLPRLLKAAGRPLTMNGFSLNEILITVALVALMLVFGIPAFGKFAKNQAVVGAAQGVQSAILEAQSLALAPQASSQTAGIKSYMTVVNQGSEPYKTYAIKNTASEEVKKYSLPKNIVIQSISTGTKAVAINFDIASRGLISFYQQVDSAQAEITIEEKNFAKIADIPSLEIKLTSNNPALKPYLMIVHAETAMMEIRQE